MHEARARVVVVCANGIGTPRVLLMSGSPGHPDGLANSSGLVLWNLMLHVSAISEAIVAKAVERVRALCSAAGAVDVTVDYGPRPVIGWHLMETARMGRDPATSVVDAGNRSHDVPNLVLVDGSSMPTNPTNTIQALALRAADSVWDARRDWSDPA